MGLPRKKKVLMIAYFFPPIGGGGVQRTVKFVKYLKDFGYEPTVVTPRSGKHSAFDASYEKDIPEGVKTFRTRYWGIHPTKQQSQAVASSGRSSGIKKIAFRILRTLYRRGEPLLFIPDPQMLWRPLSLQAILSHLKKEKYDLIYSVSSPQTDHLIARDVHRITGLPWVADFRDWWTLSTTYHATTPVHRWIEQQMEESIVTEADACVFTIPGHAAALQERLGITPKIYDEITNGFDTEDFSQSVYQHKGEIKIDYLGSYYGTAYSAKGLLAILHELIPQLKQKVRVTFTGDLDNYNRGLVQNSPLYGKNIFYQEYVPHKEATRIMQESTLLIMSNPYAKEGKDECWIPQKLFNYMGAHRPCVGIVHPDGITARIMRETGAGLVIGHDTDPKEGARMMLDYIKALEQNNWRLSYNEEAIQKYHRRELTGRLTKIFDRVVDEHR